MSNTNISVKVKVQRFGAFLSAEVMPNIGVFIGCGVYNFFDFKRHPELYAMQSAPWYTQLVPWGGVTIGIIAIAAIIKLIFRKKTH